MKTLRFTDSRRANYIHRRLQERYGAECSKIGRVGAFWHVTYQKPKSAIIHTAWATAKAGADFLRWLGETHPEAQPQPVVRYGGVA